MNTTDVIFDRLAGAIIEYVDNYLIKNATPANNKLKLKPSYDVNYEISEEILQELQKTHESGKVEDIWYLKIGGCRNINTLPPKLKILVCQFLPRFFEKFPEYKNSECLKIREVNND